MNNTQCPACVEQGQTSRVYIPNESFTTAMAEQPSYYDEEGVFHRHLANNRMATWSCSRGHSWTVVSRPGCPAGDYSPVHEVLRG